MNTKIRTTNETLGLELNKSRFLHLDDLLPWFECNYKIYELINDFWGLETKSRLVAVTKDIKDQSWKGLVSEWDSKTRLNGQFRINKDLIKGLLNISLGDSTKEFKLKHLTQLELAFFENFFVELENFWKDFWQVSSPTSHGTYSYLIWVIELDNHELGSLAIGVPPGVMPKYTQAKNGSNFRSIANNLEIEVPLDLTIGKSKLKISEVKGLEPEDLIIFEDSDTNHLIWKKNDIEQMHINIEIPEKDNPRFADLYYDGLEMANMAEDNTSDDILTDLPVELTAQFKSVQMPLQKVIELESGGILPLGLLMDSQLTLVAPGDKPIASGNLVIVGNQFGIKINKTNLKNSYPKAKLNPQAISPQDSPQAQPGPQPQQAAQPMDPEGPAINEAFGAEPQADGDNLEQELEDIGIDPKELDELEDLY